MSILLFLLYLQDIVILHMNILSIETSCDETALSLIKTTDDFLKVPQFRVTKDLVISQIDIHAEYGGVFPALAKREHAKNLPLLLREILTSSGLKFSQNNINPSTQKSITELLQREPVLAEQLLVISSNEKPDIDMIMVTYGPGLAPALWVGVNFARALSLLWNIPVIPVNHMEGHITSILLKENYLEQDQALYPISDFQFPMISLLISGGHTQLVLVKNWGEYEIIGESIDDAVGEAFDKVARMLDMEYPGGPKVSKAAAKGNQNDLVKLPRPMIHSGDYSFSFSGLKTAVRYLVEDLKSKDQFTDQVIADICWEFEHAVAEVLIKKTFTAIDEYRACGLIIAGGVSANNFIIDQFTKKCSEYSIHLYTPERKMCGDNSLMIATAGVINYWKQKTATIIPQEEIAAVGNLKLPEINQ